MQKAIEQELARLGGRVACTVIQLNKTGPDELVSIYPDTVFPAASVAKLPILVEVARQVSLGMLSWETHYDVPEALRVGGSGILSDLSSDLRPTLQDLALFMIAISDNTASNVLLDLVGMEAVNTTMRHLGLSFTRLERFFMDFSARKAGRDNWTSAGDMSLLCSYLCTELLPEKEVILKMLLRQNDDTVLAAYWGEQALFAHKTGSLEGILHDTGILYPSSAAAGPVIIAAMTAEQSDLPLTRHILARVGRIIYSHAAS